MVAASARGRAGRGGGNARGAGGGGDATVELPGAESAGIGGTAAAGTSSFCDCDLGGSSVVASSIFGFASDAAMSRQCRPQLLHESVLLAESVDSAGRSFLPRPLPPRFPRRLFSPFRVPLGSTPSPGAVCLSRLRAAAAAAASADRRASLATASSNVNSVADTTTR